MTIENKNKKLILVEVLKKKNVDSLCLKQNFSQIITGNHKVSDMARKLLIPASR